MRKVDLQWIFVLFGTAVGAGILFLPLQASASGFIPLIIATILVLPMIFFAEKNVASLVMSHPDKQVGLTEVFSQELGSFGAFISTIIYLLSCYTVVLAYAISLPIAFSHLLYVLHLGSDHLYSSIWFSFFIFLILIIVVELGKKMVLRVMSYVIYPLVIALLLVSVALIPSWNLSFITSSSFNFMAIIKGLIMVIPILVFSMNFSQSISEMCLFYKQESTSESEAKIKAYKNIRIGTVLILFFTMFFTFSTIMSLHPEEISSAVASNQTILTKVASVYKMRAFDYAAPLIAVAGIVSSFIGVYLGTREALRGIIIQIVHKDTEVIRKQSAIATDIFVVFFIFITLWLASIFNPSIVSILGQLTAPCIALMIFFLPLFIIYRSKGMISYRKNALSIFLALSGIVVVIGYFIGSII
ncbi:amino acid permease [Pseudofrancisella aestuarii]|uniref:Amino acid permease n=1 Tax=Pseudofrancisella aestuarii TaxID=2670347 RepID=A0ABV9TBL1_9GAMM|nr:aromatic amino acid transport family protein [Pseudofrancisella aestuarii]